MRHIVFSLVAATALLASVGAAIAKEPVKLTDVQLDKAAAGDAETSYLLGLSTTELGNLTALTNWTLGFLNGVPQALPAQSALSVPTITTP